MVGENVTIYFKKSYLSFPENQNFKRKYSIIC